MVLTTISMKTGGAAEPSPSWNPFYQPVTRKSSASEQAILDGASSTANGVSKLTRANSDAEQSTFSREEVEASWETIREALLAKDRSARALQKRLQQQVATAAYVGTRACPDMSFGFQVHACS